MIEECAIKQTFELLIFLCFPTIVCSQNCDQALVRAQRTYDAGVLAEVAPLLEGCLETGFNKADKQRAYRLLILTNLYSDQISKAEENMIRFLQTDSEYEINEADPAEFVALFNSYRTYPIISAGVVAGGNVTYVQPSQRFGVDNTETNTGAYSLDPGFQLGVTADFTITQSILFSPELNFVQSSFRYRREMYDYTELLYRERQSWLEIPFGIKLMLSKKKLRPFITAGVSGGFMLQGSAQLDREFITNESSGEILLRETQESDVVLTDAENDLRIRLNYQYFLGLGFKYKIPQAFIFGSFRYHQLMRNQVNITNRYTNPEMVYRYGYVDDDFLIGRMQLSFGILYCIYKPKKMK